ncbi:RNA polymerase sigma-70 factor, ECF subfamily [Hymenobacter daecheongensis DSM 21074]|uniref:RNA polymerase sigma-70 factor, ECF subfamily n=1 Tax=Hymenobacter daecheongensis DSM 21074 TaxID=1121955 RepID=A0A1M6A1H6_9BACT|nr:RNA polymerase sigma-70 factor [Hymenobacter daecheongensis]SHI30033.1 RNA polymerase sigma-70 factor, ECF subfamily [Hymenobacter daecheongensis DSM 21074]
MAVPPSEAALEARLAHLRATDAEAFMELLFREFYRPLGNVIHRVVQDRAVTEDLLQDVFLRIWNSRDTLTVSTTYGAYLYRAALNAALRHTERHQRQVPWAELPAAAEPAADNALHALYQQEAEASVAAALARLPPQCRAVFTMSRYDELSYQQIAETLDISPKTVENQMGKALRIMRKQLSGLLKNMYLLLL